MKYIAVVLAFVAATACASKGPITVTPPSNQTSVAAKVLGWTDQGLSAAHQVGALNDAVFTEVHTVVVQLESDVQQPSNTTKALTIARDGLQAFMTNFPGPANDYLQWAVDYLNYLLG